jgi:hypothetical protein
MTAISIIFLFVTISIIIWGLTTDWTFSGLLKLNGSKCTPDDKDPNSTSYTFYDGECIIRKCKAGWKVDPFYGKTCVYKDGWKPCENNTVNIEKATSYLYNKKGECKLVNTCELGWNPKTDKTACEDEYKFPSEIEQYQLDGVYKNESKDTKIDIGPKDSVNECRKIAEDNGGVAIAVNTPDRSCVYYKSGWRPMAATTINKGTHYTECLNQNRKVINGCA